MDNIAIPDFRSIFGTDGLHGKRILRSSLVDRQHCEVFYKKQHLAMSRREIVENQMIFGGIPYYSSQEGKERIKICKEGIIFFEKKLSI